MTEYLTMNTDENNVLVWTSCSCGWMGHAQTVPPDDRPDAALLAAVTEGRQHLRAVHGAFLKSGAKN